MVSGTAGMVGMTLMLSIVRRWGVETDVNSFRPVWAMCAAIAALVHVVGWMIEAGAQHKAPAQEVQEGEGDSLLRTPDRGDDE